MRQRKYFKSRKEALKACEERNKTHGNGIEVFKMPKAQGIADNTLFVPSLNTLTRTKLNTAVVNDFLP